MYACVLFYFCYTCLLVLFFLHACFGCYSCCMRASCIILAVRVYPLISFQCVFLVFSNSMRVSYDILAVCFFLYYSSCTRVSCVILALYVCHLIFLMYVFPLVFLLYACLFCYSCLMRASCDNSYRMRTSCHTSCHMSASYHNSFPISTSYHILAIYVLPVIFLPYACFLS